MGCSPQWIAAPFSWHARWTSGWQTAKFSTQARTITLTGLATGSVGQARARAPGGSTGQSDRSTPSSKIVD
jgi:hypothetical protein